MTRGEANANPGNIRTVAGTTWLGQAPQQNDDTFVQFMTPSYGIRAIVRIMRSYERKGIDTIQEAIDRWSPPNENNSAAYVSDVCQRCDMPPDEVLSLESIMPQLVEAIIWHENGECIYSPDLISQGIELA